MKRVLFVLLSLFMLVACNGESETAANNGENTEEKKTEMSDSDFVESLEQVTFRLVNAYKMETGSGLWKSELRGAIERSESVIEEIQEEYEDIPKANIVIEVAEKAKEAAEISLNGREEHAGTVTLLLYSDIEEIVKEHTEAAEMPRTLKTLLQ